jgi:hypothetical protein
MKKLLTIFGFIIAVIGCNKQDVDLKEFYFQMKDFSESKTYVFVDQSSPDDVINFKMYYKIIDSDTIFTSETFNADEKLIEVFVEKIDASKSTMSDYCMVNYNSQGIPVQQFANIIETEVYSYSSNSYPLTWKLKMEEGNNEHFVIKKRSIQEVDGKVNVLGKLMDCIVFNDEYLIEDNYGLTKFHQESYYAKGLGLVGYKRFIDDNHVMNYRLQEIR